MTFCFAGDFVHSSVVLFFYAVVSASSSVSRVLCLWTASFHVNVLFMASVVCNYGAHGV